MTKLDKYLAIAALMSVITAMIGCEKLQPLVERRPSENMPAYHPTSDVFYPDQKWSAYDRQWFYHAGQGTELMPYAWFMALEQPHLKPFGTVAKFHEEDYLTRFGFIPDQRTAENPDSLPVGFAKDNVADPETGEKIDVVGLTCAACHTGQLEYQGKAIRIDGGSAVADLASFQTELGFAAGMTEFIPGRFDRFAKTVLGENATPEEKTKLHAAFKEFLDKGLDEKKHSDDLNLYPTAGGFGRTDALARIGNYVFGTELDNQNLRIGDAPVSFPPIFYTSWFSWVQYNASIQQPMVRNIGEALGVRARVNLTDPKKLYQSTVNVKNLHDMEDRLAGPTPFSGLHSPVWPEKILGSLDQDKVAKGAELYKTHCQHCHLPPLDSAEIQKPQLWEDGLQGHRFLKLNQIPLQEIGTDPRAATNWQERTAVTGILGLGTVTAAQGLREVTSKIAGLNYAELKLTPEQQAQWNGYRDYGVTSPLAYRARPLAGIWATPPFLHNGSVPNLYEMLLPADQRDKKFYLGSREFDPKKVGFRTDKFEGAFEFRTDQPGNSNAGHEFTNRKGPGAIGPELTDDERWAIIEYLKSM